MWVCWKDLLIWDIVLSRAHLRPERPSFSPYKPSTRISGKLGILQTSFCLKATLNPSLHYVAQLELLLAASSSSSLLLSLKDLDSK